jgi:hypothetical protein
MIFKRRDKRLTFGRLKELLLPKKGWRRALDYFIHRVKRLPDTPHKIAIGIATGVFCSFTPFFGLHFFLAAFVAYIFKGNVVAALFGTFFGNPVTWPFIASFSVKLGQIILGHPVTNFETFLEHFVEASDATIQGVKSLFGYGESDWALLYSFFRELFLPYFIGGFVLGVIAALFTYFVFRPIIYAYKVTRKKKKYKKLNKNSKSLTRIF